MNSVYCFRKDEAHTKNTHMDNKMMAKQLIPCKQNL